MHDAPPDTASLGGIPPDAFVLIIGAMKCGTTSLYRYLVQHPQVCPSRFKEPEFFSEHQDHRRDDITRYHDLWNFDPRQHRYVLEASTGYTKYPFERGVPERILAGGIRPRLIYLVRNPFERIVSEFEFRPVIPYPRPRTPIGDSLLLEVSNYYLQLARYRPHFDREQLLVLDFDQLKTEPLELMESVCRFLDLDPGLADWEFGVHYSTPRWSRFQVWLNQTRIFQRLHRPRRDRIHGFLGNVLPPRPRRELTEAERAFIHDALHDDMIRLGDEYGIDVSRWGFE